MTQDQPAKDNGIKAKGDQAGFPENFVIVIGRQFGSGGRTIGKIIADRLGIDYYDTELLKKSADKEGISAKIFEEHDEKKPSSIFKNLLQGVYGIADNFHTVPLSGESVYNVQSKVIRDLCKKGGCVFVGRNADVIMREHPYLLTVFLHSPIDIRCKRILKRNEAATEDEAKNMALQHDKRRESYYNFYAGDKKWGTASNYDLCIDTSYLGNEDIADIIISFAKAKFNRNEVCRSDTGEESPGNIGRHAF